MSAAIFIANGQRINFDNLDGFLASSPLYRRLGWFDDLFCIRLKAPASNSTDFQWNHKCMQQKGETEVNKLCTSTAKWRGDKKVACLNSNNKGEKTITRKCVFRVASRVCALQMLHEYVRCKWLSISTRYFHSIGSGSGSGFGPRAESKHVYLVQR